MYEGKTIAAVVPAHNAADRVGGVIDSLPGFVDRAYVVDDGSTDETLRVVRERATTANDAPTDAPVTVTGVTLDPSVVPVVHGENRGVGAAVKTGYRRALADGVDVTLVVDAQVDPDALERVVHPVAAGDADYAKETRPADRDATPRHQRLADAALSVLAKAASGYWDATDSRNGTTAVSWAALEAVDVEALYEDHGYRNDLLARLNAVDATIADVPRSAAPGNEAGRVTGESTTSKVSALLFRNFAWRLKAKYFDRGSYPVPLLYVVGALGASAGVAAVLAALLVASAGAAHALVVFAAGALFVCLAVALDRTENRDLAVSADDAR